jgi:hypothetical protein
LEVKNEVDGSATVVMDMDSEFVEWFCHFHGLEEFSQDKFNEWFSDVLSDYIKTQRLVQP